MASVQNAPPQQKPNSNHMIGINKGSELNLNKLVHLALTSSPRVGVVNFNVLKTFLLELLKALNLQNFEPSFGEDADAKSIIDDAIKSEISPPDEALMNLIKSNESAGSTTDNTSGAGKSDGRGISILTSDLKPLSLERFHVLEDKYQRLEQQIASLNSLPPNQQIIERAKEHKSSGGSAGPLLEIWQYTQLSKRLESAEEGITKLTSLLQDLIGDIKDLKDSQTKNNGEIQALNDKYKNLLEMFKEFEKFKKYLPSLEKLNGLEKDIDNLKLNLKDIDKFNERLNKLSNDLKNIETNMANMVMYPELDHYVTWSALESALKGLKDALDSKAEKSEKEEKVAVENRPAYTQTTPVPQIQPPVPPHARTPSKSRPSSQNANPTKELEELLNKLGTLNDRHEHLKEEVDKLREELAKKQGGSFKLPDDFAQRLDEIKLIKAALEDLRHGLNNESDKRMQLESIIANINREIENIKNLLKECMKNNQLNRDEIEGLKEAIKMLDETKADKNWVKAEFEKKAEKRDLDNKVNKRAFDDHCHEYADSMNKCNQKQTSLEDEFKKSTENIFKELESKLDRLELDSLKDYIEKQMRKLKKLQRDSMAPQVQVVNAEDDAAGLRKQLLRFHCLSCDKPIEINPNTAVIPSLPSEKGMRPIQTPRPYTTFELDQIRQFQRQQNMQEQNYDLFASVRQCGGPHTLTVPHKKVVKVPQTPGEDVAVSTIPKSAGQNRSEVQILGQDGQIYKGRIDAKLPVEIKKSVKYSNYGFGSTHHLHKNTPSTSTTNMNNLKLNSNQINTNNLSQNATSMSTIVNETKIPSEQNVINNS